VRLQITILASGQLLVLLPLSNHEATPHPLCRPSGPREITSPTGRHPSKWNLLRCLTSAPKTCSKPLRICLRTFKKTTPKDVTLSQLTLSALSKRTGKPFQALPNLQGNFSTSQQTSMRNFSPKLTTTTTSPPLRMTLPQSKGDFH
jgi:hypothetical protein